ncbi:tetratricopeptide repeat protein [Iodobacter sp.]|uniref:tetratricopeptide repeat protein n=1 Tax=Iodobacter sp. TaxID=1915058 RepID=UPI0025F81658|nr:tetratricopeptide repeat protein [Iodobacter sp.]
MSLLLQALKKAEEAKRLREATALEGGPQYEEAVAASQPVAAALSVSELALELEAPIEPPHDLSPPAREVTTVPLPLEASPPVEEWQFVPLPLLEEAVLEAKSNPVIPLSEPLITAEPTASAAEIPPPIEDDLTWLKQASAASVPAPLPPVTPVQPAEPMLAPTLTPTPPAPFAKPLVKAASRSKILPWLVLAGVLIAGGMGGYFWWQYQSLMVTQAPAVAAAAVEVASPPAASAPIVLSPPPSPVTPELNEPTVVVKVPAQIVPTSIPRQFKNNVASVKERSGGPDGAGVRFDTQNNEAAVPLPLVMAYRAFQEGDYRRAEEAYRQMLQLDGRNRDALLGMAVLAVKRGAGSEAAQFYRQVLALNPRDEAAQAGLYALTPSSEGSEAGLRQLASQQSGAAFALANFYAGQGRWSEAQSAYFQALSLDSNNADYAFNLAISLEHLQETKTAARYYRQALAGRGSFDRAVAEARLKELELP